jgi:predicted ATPase/DNA-binding SARP family transcriptional activator
MRVGLLGGLEVLDESGRVVVVAGTKQRSLLAMLALRAGRVVPTDQLVEGLWGEDPPPGVRNGLQALASKLRRSLGSTELVAMHGGGYALELAEESIDVHRYEHLIAGGLAAADAGDPAHAVEVFAEADSLWRGDALADFTYENFAAPAIRRLSELRLATIEQRLEIELAIGRHVSAVVEIEGLVKAHPIREQLRGLLMTALYRSGRQAEALRVFQDGRTMFGEELGLEPGPELRRLESAILAQDPSLDAPVAAAPHAGHRGERHSTIPESLTPLIGRDEELRELRKLVAGHRFVTLVGPGGVGKTRLALAVARAEAAVLAHGGCLVELAPVGDPTGVRSAIASALDLPDSSRVAEMIGDRDLLILLDNCEHVITMAAEVAEDLLRRCPALRIVATSREGLRVGGETVWMVPPLAVGDAARLFVTRAEAAGVRLDLTDDLLQVISDVCSRLDGMPLAIELAAARTRAFPIEQIASRLNDRFRLLTGGSRTALPRQQTLRAVVDWSYDLLFDDEQRVFERLSVFPGGCDLPTAEAVCADDTLAADDLGDIIRALVDKSLVVAVRTGDELRFTQLQTLAHYGQEKLAERGDATRIRDAMAAHYAALCGRSAAAFTGEGQRAWITAIGREQDNLRAALEWAVVNDDAETALGIAGGASWPHWLAGTVTEAKRWIDDAFGCQGEAGETTRALALMGRGVINLLAGSPDHCDADLADALATFRRGNHVHELALTYSFYAELPQVQNDTDGARLRRLEVLGFYVDLPDEPFSLAARAYSRAKLATMDGDLVAAEAHFREATAGFASGDRPVMRTICLGMLADFDERAGRYEAAADRLEEAVGLCEALGLRGFNGSLLARLAWQLLQSGDVARAEVMSARSLELGRRLRHLPVLYLALTGSAVLHRHHGRNGDAAAAATEALGLRHTGWPRRFGNRIDPSLEILTAAAACCVVLGVVAVEAGEAVRGARLLGHAARLRGDAGVCVPALQGDDIDRARDVATSLLGHDGLTTAWDRGRQMDVDELVVFAS